MRLTLWFALALLLAEGVLAVRVLEADARPGPWRGPVGVEREFAYVEGLAARHVPAVGECAGRLQVRHEVAPVMPGAYTAQAAGDEDVAAGAVVNGYYVGAPLCVVVVRDGTPIEMCDRLTHELYHAAGFGHRDRVPTMDGSWVPACRDDARMRMLQRFRQAFAAAPGPCRALSRRRIECVMRPDTFTFVWVNGID